MVFAVVVVDLLAYTAHLWGVDYVEKNGELLPLSLDISKTFDNPLNKHPAYEMPVGFFEG